MPKHSKVKLQNAKYKEKILNATREKEQINYKRTMYNDNGLLKEATILFQQQYLESAKRKYLSTLEFYSQLICHSRMKMK